MDKPPQTSAECNQGKSGNTGTTTQNEMVHSNRPHKKTRAPVIWTIFSVVAYVLFFIFTFHLYGHAMAISAIIPIIVVGWFYGLIPGACAGILSFPINILMYVFVGRSWTDGIMLNGGGILGTLSLIFIGAVIGRVRDLSIQLKNNRDKLDDLVQLKTAELFESNKDLRETKEFLDNIIESSLDCIIIADKTGTITRTNEAFLTLLGYEQAEIEGMHVMELSITKSGTYESTTGEIISFDDEFFSEAKRLVYEELFEEGKIVNWETYYLRRDQKIVPVEMNITYIYNKKGEIIGSVGMNRDITERRKAEKKIVETRDFLENIFKTTADGIIVSSPEGYITMVNEAVEKMLGYSRDELIGKHPTELGIKGDDHDRKREEFVASLQEDGHVIGFEHTWLKKDGSLLDIGMNITFLKDTQENITGAVASVRDITERKKVEKEIKETKDFLENTFRTSVDGIFTTDGKGYITMVNDAVKRMLGYSKVELMGKHSRELSPEGEKYEKEGLEFIEKLHQEETIIGRERVLAKRDGTLLDIEQSVTFLRDSEGNLTGSVSSFRDITERKQSREALEESEKRYHNLIEFANIGIIVAEKNKITHMNRNAAEIYGYSKDELVGQSPSILVPKQHREKHKQLLKNHSVQGKEIKMIHEEEGIRKDGTTFPLEVSFALTNPEEDTVIAVMRDITNRKEMENKLLQSEKLKSLGELAGGVAHDFNNVLAAILGRVQLLKMQFNPPDGIPEQRKSMINLIKSLGVIEKASFDGAETVRRIQEFARKRADDKDFTQIEINELLENSLEFTRMRWKDQTESKGISVDIQREFSQLAPTLGSASELREVFTNIINNALDAMPEGGALKIATCKEDDLIVINIADTGVGIPEAIMDRIFDPFYTTKGVRSTGLGMSISYGIINRHKGTIGVESREGQGTTFTIKLPVIEEFSTTKEQKQAILLKQRKARILIVEDEEEVRKLLAEILAIGEHEVEVAANGTQGLELFEKGSFDLVFTDLGMPDLSGWEVAKKIKAINGKVPIVLVTGWNVEIEDDEKRNNHVDRVIQKPFQLDQVLSAVQEMISTEDRCKAV
jgi:PAS domain S-box-containing protein